MNNNTIVISHGLTAPLANARVVLFSTVAAFPGKRFPAMYNCPRLVLNATHDQAFTLEGFRSSNRGSTWLEVYDSASIAAPGAGVSTFRDLLIGEFDDFKLELVNSGTNQTAASWSLDLALTALVPPATP